MTTELVAVISTDKLRLPGLLFSPEKPTNKVAIWLHGMGDNGVFYHPERLNIIAEALAKQGIALLAFNNRGAHNSKSLKIVDDSLPEDQRSYQGGTFYEKIEDCVKDIDGSVDLLKQNDFTEFYLMGHSSGANKICVYDSLAKNNPFSKYVLAGPGDDVGLHFLELGEKKFWQALKYSAKFATKEPFRIMPKYSGMNPFSAQSAWDILNPDGAYNTFPYYECTTEHLGDKKPFGEYQKIELPTLVILGSDDEGAVTAGGADKALDLFVQHTSNAMLKKLDFTLIPNADHSFHGQEKEFAERVADWLANGS